MGNTNIQEDGTLAKQLFLAIRAHQMHVTPEKVVKEAEKFIESLPPLEKSSKTIHSRSSVCANSYQPRRSHPKPAHQVMKRNAKYFPKDWEYLDKLPKEIPPNRILRHNNVRPIFPLGRNGFRAWLRDRKPDDEPMCDCPWCVKHVHHRYRTV